MQTRLQESTTEGDPTVTKLTEDQENEYFSRWLEMYKEILRDPRTTADIAEMVERDMQQVVYKYHSTLVSMYRVRGLRKGWRNQQVCWLRWEHSINQENIT